MNYSPNLNKLDKDKLRAIDIAHIKQLKVNGVIANTMGKNRDRAVLSVLPNNSFYFHVVAPIVWQIRWDEKKDGWRIYWKNGDKWVIHTESFYDLNDTYLKIMQLQLSRTKKAMKNQEEYYDDMDIETEYMNHTGIQAGFTKKDQERMIIELARAKGMQKATIERKMVRLHNRREWLKKQNVESEFAKKHHIARYINELIAIEDEIELLERKDMQVRKKSNAFKRTIKSGYCAPPDTSFFNKGSKRIRTKMGDICIERHPEAQALLRTLLNNNIA
jgi:hypothetical protein